MATNPIPPATLPRPLPLLGHALRFKRQPLEFLESLRPLGDVVAIRLGLKPAYVLNSPDLIRQMLVVEPQAFGAGLLLEKVQPFIGNGLITLRGAEHRRHRRLLQPAFHHSSIARYVEVMRRLATARASSWQEGQQIVADVEMMELATAVVGKTLFSIDLGQDAVDEVVGSMPMLLKGIRKRLLAPTDLLEKLPTAGNRRLNAAIRRIHQVVEDMIAEYRRTGINHGDLASMMLTARDEQTGEGLSDLQVRDEALTMLAAGTQTTATTIAWALHILSTHHDIQERAHAQIREVLGDRALASDDLERLDYIRRLLTETLRLYPPAWLLSRRAASEVTLGNHVLPPGASILFSPYVLHRDPSTYPDPEVFDPDRWIPERAKSIPRPAFIPFGAGNRQCLGEGFAWVEATVVLAVILQRWRVRPVPGQIIRKVALATLVPSRLPLLVERA
ncbi:MAG TPA: cytochrome P450 [Candidatus Limnocylindrales bacterium]|nr:cytochrome P450 [Candidatus Limnocylindrales bacterium]